MRGNVHLVFACCMIFLAANNTAARRCDRAPDGHTAGRTPADGRFMLKISGNGSSYVPNTIYTVTLKAQSNLQIPSRFTGFLIVAEPEDMLSNSFVSNKSPAQPDVGTFSILGDSLTKISEKCPNAVMHSSTFAKSDVQVLWSSPPPGSGCVTLKATVVEHHDVWYMDEGPLSKTLCEDVEETFDMQPPIIQQCCACDEAKYEVTFEGLWSRHTHPKDFPDNGWLTRFSDVIGASHAAEYRFWDYNRQATEGLRQLAEHGATRVLESELKAESNHIRTIIKARGISYPNLTGKTFAVFRVDSRHHLMSLVSMIDPSPDWIVGVSGLELCNPNCSWVESKVLNLYPWDAGTDSGPTYISPDQPTTPRDVIRRIRPNFPNDPRSPFYDPAATDMKPLARLYLSRQRLYEKTCGDNNGVGTDDDTDNDPCAIGNWMEWSPCSKTCGEGIKRRQRYYLSATRAESAGCSKKISDRKKCRGHRRFCRQEVVEVEEEEENEDIVLNELPKQRPDEDNPETNDENADCPTTPWSFWSACTATCGKGRMMRTRQLVAKDGAQMEMLRRFTRMNKQKRALWRKEKNSRAESREDEEEEPGEDENDGGEEDEEDDSKKEEDVSDACAHVKLMEQVVCDGPISSCEITGEDARRREQFAGLDLRDQIRNRHPVAGDVSSLEVTGDGTLSGYDGPTNSPSSRYNNNIEEEDSRKKWKPRPGDRRPDRRPSAKKPKYPERDEEEEDREEGEEQQRKPSKFNHKKPLYRPSVPAHRKDRHEKEDDEDEGKTVEEEEKDVEEDDEDENVSKHRPKQPNKVRGRVETRPKNVYKNSKEAIDQDEAEENSPPDSIGIIEEPVGQIKSCKVTPWSSWSECNVTCGRGFKRQSRRIIQHPMNGGKNCPKKLLRRKKCKKLKPCRKNDRQPDEDEEEEEEEESEEDNTGQHGSNHYNSMNPTWGPGNPISNVRVDCILSSWSSWSPCAESCGMGAVRQRTRSIIRQASGGGVPCSARLDKQSCDLMPCPL